MQRDGRLPAWPGRFALIWLAALSALVNSSEERLMSLKLDYLNRRSFGGEYTNPMNDRALAKCWLAA